MEVLILDNLDIMKFQDLENTFGPMAKCMKVNGKITKCMAEELSYGETANAMRDNLFSTKEKVTELSNGRTDVFTKANGKMANNMESVFSQAKIIRSRRANG